MPKYLIPQEDGHWQGLWDDEIGAPPPPEAIEVSHDVFLALMQNASRLYIDGQVIEAPPAPPYVPPTLSRFQARAGLMQRGLLADVEALVANSSPLAQLAWAETIEWRRDSPTLNSLAKDGLGLTDAEIDELFIEAAQIQA